MVSNTLLISQLTNGEAENNLHKQSEKNLCRSSNRSQAGVRSVRLSGDCTHVNEESLDISGATTRESVGTSNSNTHSDVITKGGKRQNDMILEDMYNKEYNFDDGDDDSDWDPLEKNIKVLKWFCVNCTMVNFDDVVQCDVCGEHRESGILRHGFFASPFLAEGVIDQNGSLLIERCKELCSRNVAPNNSTVVGFDERMLLHAEVEMKSHPHPERPDRLRAIAASLATAGIFPGRCSPILAREITREELLMIHSTENVEAVELASRMLASYFTPDTYANEHSALAARLAAGLCADLASAIFSGRAKNGFALVRPPGHHAGVKEAMGFCLHNNAAIAASAAQVAGAKKVLIVDWDVHHGNGTQEIFDQIKSVLYVSLHRHEGGKFYPGTGAADEVGSMGAEGYCVNIPWSCRGVGDKDYVYAFQHVVIPIASEFAPDFIIISAGFDAARGDPLGCCDVTPAGFAQMTEMLSALSGGKLLVILEGGYNLRSISSSATAVIKVLLGENPACNLDDIVPSKSGLRTILKVLKIQSKFWPALESTFSKLQSRWGVYAFQDTVSDFADPLSSRNLVRRRRQRDEDNAGPSKKQKSSSGSAPATSSSAPAPPPSSSSAPTSSSIFIPSTGAPTTTAGNIVDFFRPGFDRGTSRAPKGQGESGRHGRGKQLEVLKAQRESTLGLPEILGRRPLTSGADSSVPIFIPQWNPRLKDRAEESSIARELLQKANLPEDIKFVKSMDLEKLCNRIAVSRAMTCATVAELFRRAQELEKTRETAVAELEKQLKEAEQAKHELKVRFEEANANRVNALKAQEEALMELQATMKSLTSAHAEELKRLKEVEEAKLQAAREEAVKAFQGSCQFTATVQTIREEARKEAVKDFRASDEFAKDLLLLSTPIYLLGFTDAVKTMSSIMYNHQIEIMEEHESYYPGIEKLVDLLAEGFKKGEDLVKIKEDFEVEQAKASPPSLLAPIKEPSEAPTAEEPIIREPPTAKEPP